MDWLYAFAYVVSMSLFVLFCWGTYRYTVASADDQPVIVAKNPPGSTGRSRWRAVVGLGLTVLLAWQL